MTRYYDHIEISDISDKDAWLDDPRGEPADISEFNYMIEAKRDHGPQGTEEMHAFATDVTINGDFDLGVGDDVAITGTDIGIEGGPPERRYNIVIGL